MSTLVAEYGRVLVKRWRWIVWGILLALVLTTIVLILRPPLYRSEATVFVRTPGDVSRVEDGGDSYARARAGTYAVLVKSTSISSRVVANLGLDMKPETLSKRIDANHADGTALIEIGVSAPSPEEAQRTATVLISEFAATVRSLESVPGALVPRAEIVVIDPPGEASRILAWGVPLYFVVLGAILAGMVLGAFGAVIRSILAAPVASEESAADEPLVDERRDSTLDEAAPEPVELAEDIPETRTMPAEPVGKRRRPRRAALTDANGPSR